MKRSNIFHFPLWSKLHPPLPRTPRQSQQLLDTLTSSFRRELDREHPPNASHLDSSSGGGDKTLGEEETSKDHPRSSSHAADNHLSMILDHPLFRSDLSRHSDLHERSVHVKKAKLMNQPMVVFDELMASGSATLGAVSDCLRCQVLIASRPSGAGFVKELRNSRAGSRIKTWWWSLDEKNQAIFLMRRTATFGHACKILVAEGLQDMVFTWLQTLKNPGLHDHYKQMQFSDIDAAQRFQSLLCYLLQAEIQHGGGMSSAMRYYLDAFKLTLPKGDSDVNSPFHSSLDRPGSYLLSMQMRRSSKGIEDNIPDKVYEDYMAAVSSLLKSQAIRATLPLYHPTFPDARPFVRYVQQLPPSACESWQVKRLERNMRAGLDALSLLNDAGNEKDRLVVTHFLEQLMEVNPNINRKLVYEKDHEQDRVASEKKALISSWDLGFA